MTEQNRPPAATDPRAEALAGIEATATRMADALDVMRDMATNTISLADDVKRRVEALKGMERR